MKYGSYGREWAGDEGQVKGIGLTSILDRVDYVMQTWDSKVEACTKALEFFMKSSIRSDSLPSQQRRVIPWPAATPASSTLPSSATSGCQPGTCSQATAEGYHRFLLSFLQNRSLGTTMFRMISYTVIL